MDYLKEYIKNYDMSDPDISYKYYHSYRVMDNMELLAKCLSLPSTDITLAMCIGLLHDIGRFEQDKLYNSFKDTKMDHGDYGVEIIKKENILSNFDIAKEDYEVVYKAIKNHNKFKIEANLTPRELLFAKLIRDADKLDIIYGLGNELIRPTLFEDNNQITKEVEVSFYNNKQIEKLVQQNKNDGIIMILSFTYDINYGITLKIIDKYKYYDKIYERLKSKELFKPYFNHIFNYIKERID